MDMFSEGVGRFYSMTGSMYMILRLMFTPSDLSGGIGGIFFFSYNSEFDQLDSVHNGPYLHLTLEAA